MTNKVVNGIDVGELGQVIGDVKNDARLGEFRFQTRTKWVDGGHSRTQLTGAGKGGSR